MSYKNLLRKVSFVLLAEPKVKDAGEFQNPMKSPSPLAISCYDDCANLSLT